jgi:tetratricopeptide (TPR) repeat protein
VKASLDVNRDNLLFAVIGTLVGFIAGYLLHEVMSVRQPPRLTAEMRAQIVGAPEAGGGMGEAPAADATAAGAAGPGPAAGGGGPASQEVQQLRATLEKNPKDLAALRRLGDLNYDIGDWKRAVDLYNQYLAIKPGDADVLTDLGIAYRQTQQFDEALARFKAAQTSAPDHWQSYYNEVVVLAFDLKKFDEANQVLAKLKGLQPANPDVAKLAEAVARQSKLAA